MEELWSKLHDIIDELYREDTSQEEKEFLVARYLYITNELVQYYIGGNTNG